MPLYMDMHSIDGGVAVDDVAKAHVADLQTQGSYDVKYLRYWVDEHAGKIFCLAEAPVCRRRRIGASGGARAGGRRDLRGAGRVVRRTADARGPSRETRDGPLQLQ